MKSLNNGKSNGQLNFPESQEGGFLSNTANSAFSSNPFERTYQNFFNYSENAESDGFVLTQVPVRGNVFSQVSKFELLAHKMQKSPPPLIKPAACISPKLFPAGSATVNLPAASVLGPGRIPNGSVPVFHPAVHPVQHVQPQNGVLGYIEPHSSPKVQQNGGRVAAPSPAFNRNPSYVPERLHSDDLHARRHLMQARMEREQEEKIQQLEQQRLEEILAICAEYERQLVQPTLHHNRIITNGSLPREKRPALSSPTNLSTTSDEESLEVKPDQLDVTIKKHVYVENTFVLETPQSPRTRIRTTFKDPETLNDSKFLTPSQQLSKFNEILAENKFIKPLKESVKVKDDESRVSQDSNELPESERDLHRLLRGKDREDEGEVEKLVKMIGELKVGFCALERQEEEFVREMEIERVLLDAEYLIQKDQQKLDAERLSHLNDKQKQLDAEIERNHIHDSEIQTQALDRIREYETQLLQLSQQIPPQDRESNRDYLKLVVSIETERKTFEDLEFKHLEEEADWLSKREDLQREIQEVALRLDERVSGMAELKKQIGEMAMTTETELNNIKTKKTELLQQLEEAKTRLRDLEIRLSLENGQLRPKSKQSEEDLARISRITLDAPIDVGKTTSLNRKTMEALQEIERNRQLHLAKEGVQVIELERKRVEQLKRRAQDEVRAQWELSRQKDSQIEGFYEEAGDSISSLVVDDDNSEMCTSMISQTDDECFRDSRRESRECQNNSRPDSEYSAADVEQSISVKKRESDPIKLLQQRPLTRYLPIKGDSLNLRQHIESAGHQVESCRHVILDSITCRGVLHKLGGKFHHWNKRWFVFDRSKKSLMYYMDKTERKPRGGAYFQAIEEVYVDHQNSARSPHPHLSFVVKTRERTFHLMAPSGEAMRIWVDVIFTGAEGYREFESGT